MIAKSFARIHSQNLVNFAVLPRTFEDPDDYGLVEPGDVLAIEAAREQIQPGDTVDAVDTAKERTYRTRHGLSPRQVEIVLRGSLIGVVRDRQRA